MKSRIVEPVFVLLCGLVAFLALLSLPGCATLGIGADPLVVRCEQTEAAAYTAFNGLLQMDDANRSYWKANAPGFHDFAEFLRQPWPTEHNRALVLPKGAALIWDVNWEKNVYKTNKAAVPLFATSVSILADFTRDAVGWMALARTNLALTKTTLTPEVK